MAAAATCWCLLCLLLHFPQLSAALSNLEGTALLDVKAALIDQTNQLNSWSENIVSPCTWAHVSCNDDQQYVISVNLADLDLGGSLSGELSKLSKLQILLLQNNRISGSLPMELGNLSVLETLNAGKNALNGSIPGSWSTLANLKYLTLDNNQLSGAIPPSITELPNLLNLDLSYNKFTGQIPDAAFKLQSFNFIGNDLACGSTSMNPCQSSNMSTASAQGTSTTVSKGKIIGGVFGAVAFISSAAVVIVLCERERRSLMKLDSFVDVPAEDELKIALGQLKRFSLRELHLATNNFSAQNVIGQGAFGIVYKGILDDSTEIAVKRLLNINAEGGEEAFLQEVEMISVAVHRNLLQLIGFCITPSERILVYPYMSNRSITYCLRERRPGEPVLDWTARKKIALGAARGLEYLHDHCNPKIIHRDVKAANILVTGDYEAVVGDFGLAKLTDTSNTHVTTMVRGTMGHIAPEYLTTGRSSEKTDVFGYGVMLLELVTGQKAIELSRLEEENDVLLLDHVKNLQHEKRLNSLVDPSLAHYDTQEVEQLIQVALLCTQASPQERPKMAEVVRMLAGEGLAERWEEWQQVEIIRRQEVDAFPHGFDIWAQDSTVNQEAIELSAAR